MLKKAVGKAAAWDRLRLRLRLSEDPAFINSALA
jgi:hypothetical protein